MEQHKFYWLNRQLTIWHNEKKWLLIDGAVDYRPWIIDYGGNFTILHFTLSIHEKVAVLWDNFSKRVTGVF